MGKINLLVKYCLRNEKVEYNIKGISRDNKFKFKDFDNIMILDLKYNTLERINNYRKIKFDFYNKLCFIEEDNYKLSFVIKVLKLINKDNNFYVKYKIENDFYEIDIKLI